MARLAVKKNSDCWILMPQLYYIPSARVQLEKNRWAPSAKLKKVEVACDWEVFFFATKRTEKKVCSSKDGWELQSKNPPALSGIHQEKSLGYMITAVKKKPVNLSRRRNLIHFFSLFYSNLLFFLMRSLHSSDSENWQPWPRSFAHYGLIVLTDQAGLRSLRSVVCLWSLVT